VLAECIGLLSSIENTSRLTVIDLVSERIVVKWKRKTMECSRHVYFAPQLLAFAPFRAVVFECGWKSDMNPKTTRPHVKSKKTMPTKEKGKDLDS
jgi:hypothetical protein